MSQKTNYAAWIVGIVGVVIVVAILAAIFVLYIGGLDPNPPDQEKWFDAKSFESNGSDCLTIIHTKGDDLSVHNLTVTIRGAINGRTREPYAAVNGRHNLTSLGYESGSYLTPNDTITLNRSTLGVVDTINFETADVFLRYGKATLYFYGDWNESESTTSD